MPKFAIRNIRQSIEKEFEKLDKYYDYYIQHKAEVTTEHIDGVQHILTTLHNIQTLIEPDLTLLDPKFKLIEGGYLKKKNRKSKKKIRKNKKK